MNGVGQAFPLEQQEFSGMSRWAYRNKLRPSTCDPHPVDNKSEPLSVSAADLCRRPQRSVVRVLTSTRYTFGRRSLGRRWCSLGWVTREGLQQKALDLSRRTTFCCLDCTEADSEPAYRRLPGLRPSTRLSIQALPPGSLAIARS